MKNKIQNLSFLELKEKLVKNKVPFRECSIFDLKENVNYIALRFKASTVIYRNSTFEAVV